MPTGAQREEYLERRLPSSEDGERTILGAILLDNRYTAQAVEELDPEEFYSPLLRRVFVAMRRQFEKSQPIDPITLLEEMKRDGPVDSLGGVSTLSSLATGLPHFDTLDRYIKLVKDKALARRIVRVANLLSSTALSETMEAEELVNFCETELYGVSRQGVTSGFSGIHSLVFGSIERSLANRDRDGAVTGLATGFSEFDEMTLGLQRQELVIVAARPSMGKTALGLNIAQNVAIRGGGLVAFFSLEMSEQQLSDRIICSETGINSHHFRAGNLDSDDFDRVTQLEQRLARSALFVDDAPSISPTHIRAKLRRLESEHHALDLVIVDYLQLMTGKTRDSREREVAEVSRELKAIAKEFNLPVIALSQLSREPEKRASHMPMLSDLRESGGIEQDADVVAFIFRQDYYRQSVSEYDGLAHVIIAKNRNGPTGVVRLNFHPDTTTFSNLAPAAF
jgi:replicative DNA helicase